MTQLTGFFSDDLTEQGKKTKNTVITSPNKINDIFGGSYSQIPDYKYP